MKRKQEITIEGKRKEMMGGKSCKMDVGKINDAGEGKGRVGNKGR